jgi:hypothetical protein
MGSSRVSGVTLKSLRLCSSSKSGTLEMICGVPAAAASIRRNPQITVTQKDKYRLPKVGGKQHVNFHPRRVRRANEADLNWITQAYGRERVALSPQ